ncbi:tripartite tricarboxylate transporter permease [Methanolapillus ohkumae]|uniref:DUF112 domain-containing protein n=1 Tax=Methanolapillus ohkumae TaxID=3028298 RepID=A0AA96ZVI4_9EURY|nr:hypothetical protein MsAm2_05250 [Methanosarcinaceae archaeon Am2]
MISGIEFEGTQLFSNPLTGLFACVIFGWIFGFISGLVPGIHVNNFAILLGSTAPVLYTFGLSPITVSTIILACAVSHTFHNIIPAIFLGAPGEDTALLVLPGHRLLLDGKGPNAVRLSAMGSAGAILLSPVIMIPMAVFFYFAYPHLHPYMGFILLLITVLMVATEKGTEKKAAAFFVFLAAGLLGYFAFGLEDGIQSPLAFFSATQASVLMPLLSGLFGASQMIVSFLTESAIPDTKKSVETFPKIKFIKGILSGTITGAFVAWIPGVSSSVAAIISGFFIGRKKREEENEADDEKNQTGDEKNQTDDEKNQTDDEKNQTGDEKNQTDDEKNQTDDEKNQADDEKNQTDDEINFKNNKYIESKEEEENNAKEFIVTISAISTANALFGLLAYFIIGKTRSGAVVSIRQILNDAGMAIDSNVLAAGNLELFFLFYLTILLTGFLSYFSTICAGNRATDILKNINYQKISISVLIFLLVLVAVMTRFYGCVIFAAATLVGFLPIVLKVKKTNLMGVILFPVMLYFFGWG